MSPRSAQAMKFRFTFWRKLSRLAMSSFIRSSSRVYGFTPISFFSGLRSLICALVLVPSKAGVVAGPSATGAPVGCEWAPNVCRAARSSSGPSPGPGEGKVGSWVVLWDLGSS